MSKEFSYVACLRHVGIVVKDLEKSLFFWCDILGFMLEKKIEEKGEYIDLMMGLENVNVVTAKLSDHNGNLIELLNFRSHLDNDNWLGKPYSTGLTHIALRVKNLDEILKKLTKFKLIKSNKIVQSPDKKVRVVYAECLEGLLIEFVEEL